RSSELLDRSHSYRIPCRLHLSRGEAMRMRSLVPLLLAGLLLTLALARGVRGQVAAAGTPSAFALFMHGPETPGVDNVGFFVDFPISPLDGRTQIGTIRNYVQLMRWSYRFNDGGFVTVDNAAMTKAAVIPHDTTLFPDSKPPVVMKYARGTITDASDDLA